MKKIAVITSTRAEYGLLYPLIRELSGRDKLLVHLLVSGTHLLPRFGNTIQHIQNDGVQIAAKIPILDEDFVSDELHVADAIAKAVRLSSDIFQREQYEAVIVLGDRYELLGFCTAAVICRVPIIHIHGGEITEGAIDDKIRHAVTKLASIHFPSVPEYAQRIVQMGEDPKRVHPVGALGIDNIMKMELLDKRSLFQELDIYTELPIAAVTYHPVTSEKPEAAEREIRNVLEALLKAGVFSVITMPNSDVGGDLIYRIIQEYMQLHPERFVLKKSLGQLRYLSLLKNSDIMVGNSSSGILESASFCLPTVDIGDRQKGRMSPQNVIHCNCVESEIFDTILKAISEEFRRGILGYVNPYGDGRAAIRIADIIEETDFSEVSLIQKHFYDIR